MIAIQLNSLQALEKSEVLEMDVEPKKEDESKAKEKEEEDFIVNEIQMEMK